MSRQSVVTPIGLITQPNEYGQYKRGALSYAKNVSVRDPGKISSLPDTRVYRATIAAGTNRVVRLIYPAPTRFFAQLENLAGSHALVWVTSGGIVTPTLPTVPAYGTELATAGAARIGSQRKRFFYTQWQPGATTGFKGVITADSEGASTMRPAGLTPVPVIEIVSNTTTDAQVVTPPYSVSYRACVRRTQTDGYIMVSAASSALNVYAAAGSAQDILVTVQLAAGNNYIPGDVMEIYRTRTQTPETVSAGDSHFLAVSRVLTSTDITTNGYVTVRDTCPELGLGAELYSNPGVEGATAANFDPPASSDMALFKGHMFYAAIATPAKAVVGPRVAFGILDTNAKRLFGIGYRTTTGNIASGSPTISSVANIRGIAIGQTLFHALYAGGFTFIIGVTATTITTLNNATGTSVGATITTGDNLEATIPPEVPVPLVFFSPGELRQACALLGVIGNPFVGSSNIAQRLQSDGSVTESQSGVELIFQRPRVTSSAFSLRATNGINYSPALPDINGGVAQQYSPEIRENRYAWSKFEQPEHVPPLNFDFCGAGTLLRMVPTRDALWMFCTDGLFKLAGDGGLGEEAWRLDPADPNCVLVSRNAVGVLKETLWCYCNRGLVSISIDQGIQDVGMGVIGDLIPGANFSDTWDVMLECDQLHLEIWLTFRSGTPGAGTTVSYVYNTVTKAFFGPVQKDEYSATAYAPFAQSLAFGKVVAGGTPGNPGIEYFELDTSSTRMAGVDVRFQPLFADDPFLQFEFQRVDYIWETVNATATLTPSFDDVTFLPRPVKQSAKESRTCVGVPRNAPARAPSIRPGFQMSNVAAPWSFRGISVRYADVGEEVVRG